MLPCKSWSVLCFSRMRSWVRSATIISKCLEYFSICNKKGRVLSYIILSIGKRLEKKKGFVLPSNVKRQLIQNIVYICLDNIDIIFTGIFQLTDKYHFSAIHQQHKVCRFIMISWSKETIRTNKSKNKLSKHLEIEYLPRVETHHHHHQVYWVEFVWVESS